MPESLDFDQIARKHIGEFGEVRVPVDPYKALAEQLRLVWNARGAADIAAIQPMPHGFPYMVDVIREQDR